MTRKVILDVDPGTDDAIAIMAACLADELDVVAICSVFGNAAIEYTTINALNVAHCVEADHVPVYPGAAKPLLKHLYASRPQFMDEPVLKGSAVIDGVEVRMNPDVLPLEPAVRRPEEMKAACFYVEYLRKAAEKTTLVATGALTNLAMALVMAPDIIENIDEIVIMGGGVNKANITPSAEANFWKDPEAARLVLACGAKITLCTLDATHSAALSEHHEEQIRIIGTNAANFIANDIHSRIESYNKFQPLERRNTAPIHDALCVAYLLDPSVLTSVELCACEVDCGDSACEGRLAVDSRHFTAEKNVRVAFEADPDRLAAVLINVLSRNGGN
jgi:inosine-uridine nucleoside N-ribohydrolase